MAREVNCVCGRRFHIGHSNANVQCRKCGRWWSGRELSTFEAVATIALGGEIVRAEHRKGNRKPSRQNSHRVKQTNRSRPASNPIGSVLRWLLG